MAKRVSKASKQLSEPQERILEYIKETMKVKGYPPSVRDVCNALGFNSTATVYEHFKSLEKKGYIRRDPSKPRAIEVIDSKISFVSREIIEVPIIGKVTAGKPILAVENIEEYFPLPLDFIQGDSKDEKFFMLRVRGDSMVNVGILNGDYVIVREQSFAFNGDIIVALVDDSATIKRYYKEKGHIRLQPENPFMDALIFEKESDVNILGKVIGAIRRI
ncbi:transcriptional repressor LexA [Calorimonas adulescens]|uniref:LexA repressor n=1 Tax=Calorimonas adulescens TaxID=2606906 RepID=A0A5D8Q8T7_9THEO|nr:transcriptional repressor LexA [Calorimonas adulescens]TZE80797.1 transcriptional repressor LexA [Calorimonas adulescens]